MAPEQEEIVQVCMTLAGLEGVPALAPPPGFSFRMFRPGDEKTWTDIWRRSDRYGAVAPDAFAREFGSDARALAQRQFYLLDGGSSAIGTASAWFPDEPHGPDCGCVHWLAVVPEYQGRGLSRPLLSAVLMRMRDLGYRSAFLRTQTVRIAAIGLYLGFGFLPEVRSDKEREGWRQVCGRLAPSPLDRVDL
jgi:GNAT superfamily N-acetyltransferase